MPVERIYTNDQCVGCNQCIANCPCDEANVVRLVEGRNKIWVDPAKCIVCGNCVRNCLHHARVYSDDTERFFADLNAGKQLALIVAPSVHTNFAEAERLIGFFKEAGVSMIYDTAFGADICTWAYLKHIQRTQTSGIIAQPCPAVVHYVERYVTELLPSLAPIHSPAMCTAIYMKHYANVPGSYAFLSPCIGKADEFADEACEQLVEYNVTFQGLIDYLARHELDYHRSAAGSFDSAPHGLGALYPMPGGLRQNVAQCMPDAWVHQVEGQPEVCDFLHAYAQATGERPLLVDILNCQHGCNGGTAALTDVKDDLEMSRTLHQTKQRIIKQASKFNPRKLVGSGQNPYKAFDKTLVLSDFMRGYTDRAIRPIIVTEPEVREAFIALRKETQAQRETDCRSCGYASCRKMAEAVAKGINHVGNCVEYMKSLINEQRQQMEILAEEREQQAEELRTSVQRLLEAIAASDVQTEAAKQEVAGIRVQVDLLDAISNQLSTHVTRLRREINQYVKMGDEIVGISRQSILLSLNASVEAARAGEVGQGFAIVADQMKKLSNQTQQSAKDALQNNEIIMPLLRQVYDVSDAVLAEAQIITANVANIEHAMQELARIQQGMTEDAKSIDTEATQ